MKTLLLLLLLSVVGLALVCADLHGEDRYTEDANVVAVDDSAAMGHSAAMEHSAADEMEDFDDEMPDSRRAGCSSGFTYYKAKFNTDEPLAGDFVGIFKMKICKDGSFARYKTHFSGGDFKGATQLNYHLHSKTVEGSSDLGSTSGHYDPTYKCGGASSFQTSVPNHCESPYVCSSTDKAGCELGDTSGKMGKLTVVNDAVQGWSGSGWSPKDTNPPRIVEFSQLGGATGATWSSVIFHSCDADGCKPRLFGGRLEQTTLACDHSFYRGEFDGSAINAGVSGKFNMRICNDGSQAKYVGRLEGVQGEDDLKYHVHVKYDESDVANTGGHYDPTYKCGGASANQGSSECETYEQQANIEQFSWSSIGTGQCRSSTGTSAAHNNYGSISSAAACEAEAKTIPDATAYEWRDASSGYSPSCQIFYPSAPYGDNQVTTSQANGDAGHACYMQATGTVLTCGTLEHGYNCGTNPAPTYTNIGTNIESADACQDACQANGVAGCCYWSSGSKNCDIATGGTQYAYGGTATSNPRHAGNCAQATSVTGTVDATITEDGKLKVNWSLNGLDENSDGGIHIHYGNTCQSEATVKGDAPAGANKGHYYVPTDANAVTPGEDPWSITWGSGADGKAAGSAEFTELELGATAKSAFNRVVIVHNNAKEKVGCGVLKSTDYSTYGYELGDLSGRNGKPTCDQSTEKCNLFVIDTDPPRNCDFVDHQKTAGLFGNGKGNQFSSIVFHRGSTGAKYFGLKLTKIH